VSKAWGVVKGLGPSPEKSFFISKNDKFGAFLRSI